MPATRVPGVTTHRRLQGWVSERAAAVGVATDKRPPFSLLFPGGSQRVRGAGKAHKSGLGAQLMQRVNGGEKAASRGRGHIGQYAHLFTTNVPDGRGAMQSVLDVSDLDEVMALAELAGRSFAAERQNVTVVNLGGPAAEEQAARQAAQRRMASHVPDDRLTVPRRPPWRSDMAVDELERREREAFLIWRRDLAACVWPLHALHTP